MIYKMGQFFCITPKITILFLEFPFKVFTLKALLAFPNTPVRQVVKVYTILQTFFFTGRLEVDPRYVHYPFLMNFCQPKI